MAALSADLSFEEWLQLVFGSPSNADYEAKPDGDDFWLIRDYPNLGVAYVTQVLEAHEGQRQRDVDQSIALVPFPCRRYICPNHGDGQGESTTTREQSVA